jgi:hypothetical protein
MSIESIKKRIEDAFDRARQQPVDVHMPAKPKVFDGSTTVLATKQSTEPIYGEKESALFQKQANSLIGAVQSPHVMLHRQQLHYYVGDLNKQPRAEDLFQPSKARSART